MTENAPTDRDADDLGLTSEEWLDLQYAYNFGTIEPAPGTVEAEAFRQLDDYAGAKSNAPQPPRKPTRRGGRPDPAAHRRPDRN